MATDAWKDTMMFPGKFRKPGFPAPRTLDVMNYDEINRCTFWKTCCWYNQDRICNENNGKDCARWYELDIKAITGGERK
jgi:hypothetical protein